MDGQNIYTKTVLNCLVMIWTILSQNSVSLPNKRTHRKAFVTTLKNLFAAWQIWRGTVQKIRKIWNYSNACSAVKVSQLIAIEENMNGDMWTWSYINALNATWDSSKVNHPDAIRPIAMDQSSKMNMELHRNFFNSLNSEILNNPN